MAPCPGRRAVSETRQLLSPSGSWATHLRTISNSYHTLSPERWFNVGAMRNTTFSRFRAWFHSVQQGLR